MINIIFSDIKLIIKKLKSSYLMIIFILSLNFLYNISSFFNLPFLLIPIGIFFIVVCFYQKIILHEIKILNGSNIEYKVNCKKKLFMCGRLFCITLLFLIPNYIISVSITSKIEDVILHNDGIVNLFIERLLYLSIKQLVSLITYILIAYLAYATFEHKYNIRSIFF